MPWAWKKNLAPGEEVIVVYLTSQECEELRAEGYLVTMVTENPPGEHMPHFLVQRPHSS